MIDFDRKNLARIVEIKNVIDHPNADRLDIVTIDEWQCVSSKGTFNTGDKAVYFEIDSILPQEIEEKIFGKDAKVKLKGSRVRTIKLRKAISQGLAVPVEAFNLQNLKVGIDVTKKLGIGKYVPTPKKGSVLYTGGVRSSGLGNENFTKMRKPSHHKTVGGFPDRHVMITEKIHGTSFVAGWVEREDRTIAQKINKIIFGKYQFCWRSMNRQLQDNDTLWENIKRKIGLAKEARMDATLYGRMCIKYNLKEKLFHGQVVTGEIYGYGIQDGYMYGCAEGEQKLVAFGFRQEGVEACPDGIIEALTEKGIPMVPILFCGMYDAAKVDECTIGASVLDPKTKVREGCVVVTMNNKTSWAGTCIVKSINPKYLLGDQSEFN